MSNGDYPVRHLFLLPMLLVTTANVDDQRMHFVLDPAHSDIRASVAFLGIGSQTARFPSASGKAVLDPGNIEAMQLDMLIDARAVTAGDRATTAMLRGPSFFDVAHYPALHFVGEHFAMTGEKTALLTGHVTARGVTRPASVTVAFTAPPMNAAAGEPLRLTATMAINRDDFGMTAYHILIGRHVTINIQAMMVPG
ncbi:MAG: YceI family protein [Sphingomonas sp.]|nr:YceI family protein [Sphingomonas sp.]